MAIPRDEEYEITNLTLDPDYPILLGLGIKCKNFAVCEEMLPEYWHGVKGHYICTLCASMFGAVELEIRDSVMCSMCDQTTLCAFQPYCRHPMCVECFRGCYYGEKCPTIPFPYSDDIQSQYESNPMQIRWEIQYPLIKMWQCQLEALIDEWSKRIDYGSLVRACPLCMQDINGSDGMRDNGYIGDEQVV